MKTVSSFRKKVATVIMLVSAAFGILVGFLFYALVATGKLSEEFGFLPLIVFQVGITANNLQCVYDNMKDREFTMLARNAWTLLLLFFLPAIYCLLDTPAIAFMLYTAFMPAVMTLALWAEWVAKNVSVSFRVSLKG